MSDVYNEKLAQVVSELDPANDGHWTKEGLIDLNHVKEAMGCVVSRKQMTDAGFNIVTRESTKAGLEKPAVIEDDGAPEPAEKTLHNSDISGTKENVPDVQTVGNGDAWQLLCKASSESEGWMKSTKAYQIGARGCIVQVTTQQRNEDGSYAVAEAVTWVPHACVEDDENGGRKLA